MPARWGGPVVVAVPEEALEQAVYFLRDYQGVLEHLKNRMGGRALAEDLIEQAEETIRQIEEALGTQPEKQE